MPPYRETNRYYTEPATMPLSVFPDLPAEVNCRSFTPGGCETGIDGHFRHGITGEEEEAHDHILSQSRKIIPNQLRAKRVKTNQRRRL